MPIEVLEKVESRRVTTGDNPAAEYRYVIRGTADPVAARTALLATSPTLVDVWGGGFKFLPRVAETVEPISPDEFTDTGLWEGIVNYGLLPQTGESVFSFDTGGGTQHITNSLGTVARYAPAGAVAPDCKGALGVTADSVEGVDITVPVYQFVETHYLPDSVVTPAYKATLFALTGKVNSAAFKGFAAGECLFLGAAGTQRGQGDWELTYRFAAYPNVTNLTIGDITGIAKKGWEYLWVRYTDSEDVSAKALVKRPTAVYIEKVYEYGNLSLLGI